MCEQKVTVYCGEEKGKTIAAFGCAVQSAIQGDSVIIIQFLKGRREGELEFLRRLEPEVKVFRFARSEKNFSELSEEEQQEEKMNLRNGFNFARKVLITRECSLLILDEFLGLLDNHMFSKEDLDSLLSAGTGDTRIMFTGRTMNDMLRGYTEKIYEISGN
ncbi:MAG: cob(I)yrinic acid a,c-diamide adenosyltransferase [Lachnospiraceae bacterium]|nr:cob(I)yrinic acid a,c-diamide adenosyltransferase [Lachnospiraceae bacterium]